MVNMVNLYQLEKICTQLYDITKHNAHQYQQVQHLGRNAYHWGSYVIKSAPGPWNFWTDHEYHIHQYIMNQAQGDWFPELIHKVQVQDRLFIIMEYLPFLDLHKLYFRPILGHLRLNSKAISCLRDQGNSILAELCRLNIIHRDIRPPNLLFDPKQQRLILIDFNFAIRADQGEMVTKTPEQAELLNRAVNANLGGAYRHPSAFNLDSDTYSFNKIMETLEQRLAYQFWTKGQFR